MVGILLAFGGGLLAGSLSVSAHHLDLSVTPSDVWVKESGVRLDFSPEDPAGTTSFHTPYVFRFPDGTLRMYYDITAIQEIRSAVSTDGLTWTKESGARLSNAAHAHVLQMGSTYRMYFETISPGDAIRSATSTDGLAWALDPGARLGGNARDPVVVELGSGGYRMYFRLSLDILSATSADGLTWSVEAGIRVPDAREFAVVRLPDGSIVLYYGQASPAFGSIRSARSVDGLAFTLDPDARLTPGPAGSLDAGGVLTTSILQFPGGAVRMYYQGAPGGDINNQARVLSAVSEPPAGRACPLSHGFWKTHPGTWPVESLLLGDERYSKDQLLALLRTPPRGDASVILALQLIAAKLNIANGSDPAPIDDSITAADAILAGFDGLLPYAVRASLPLGGQMTGLASELDRYNNRTLTLNCIPVGEGDPDLDPYGVSPFALAVAVVSGCFWPR